MRTIIAGSRGVRDMRHLWNAIEACGWRPTVVLCGCALGADMLGLWWAEKNRIPVEKFPADWGRYGKSAGYRRNVQMADAAEALIALWDGKSKGTEHMINIANTRFLRVYVHRV